MRREEGFRWGCAAVVSFAFPHAIVGAAAVPLRFPPSALRTARRTLCPPSSSSCTVELGVRLRVADIGTSPIALCRPEAAESIHLNMTKSETRIYLLCSFRVHPTACESAALLLSTETVGRLLATSAVGAAGGSSF